MSPSPVGKGSSAIRSKTSRRKCTPYARNNLRTTARRASSRFALMPSRCASWCVICSRTRLSSRRGNQSRERRRFRATRTRCARSRQARRGAAFRPRALARRAARPGRGSRLGHCRADAAWSLLRALARLELRNRHFFFRAAADGGRGDRVLVRLEVDAPSGGQAPMRDMSLSIAVVATIGFVAGFLAGVSHFALLAWNAQLFVDGSIGKAVALQFARVALATLVLILLARLSLFALLAGAVGFLPPRALMVWRFGGLR